MRPMQLVKSPSRRLRSSGRALRPQLAMLMLGLRGRRGSLLAEGFTLIELMIVVAIIGILSAIALPNFIEARNAAKMGARVGEALGFAKECSVLTISGVGDWNPGGVNSSGTSTDGVSRGSCGENVGGTITANWPTGAKGVKCLDETSKDKTQLKATITVAPDGSLKCAFS